MVNKIATKKYIKKVGKYFVFLFLYLVLLYGALSFARYITKESSSQEELPPEAFYPVDYSADILENNAYLSLDRSVYYMDYGTGEALTAENYQKLGVASEFFYRYFESIILGDVSAYRSMLTDDYIDEFDPPEEFTMQMLYDIQVNQSHSASSSENNGETVNVYHFAVTYKIFENNGTFRRDIASNQSVTQYYDLIYCQNKLFLDNISNSIVLNSEEVANIKQRRLVIDLSVIGIFILLPLVLFVAKWRIKLNRRNNNQKDDEKNK